MTTTVVPSHGSKAYLKINEVELTQYCNSTDLAHVRDLAHVKVFGLAFELVVAGIIASTLKAAMSADTTLLTALYTVLQYNGTVTWEFGPFGNSAPNTKLSGALCCSNLAINTNAAGPEAKVTFDSALSGTVTVGAYS